MNLEKNKTMNSFKTCLIGMLLLLVNLAYLYSQHYKGQVSTEYKQKTLDNLYTNSYLQLKKSIENQFTGINAGKFGDKIPGIITSFSTNKKEIAFAFDACIGHSNDYNKSLIEYLRKEKIPATLFITGSWIDTNPDIVKELADDGLFEIENHGLFHRICSIGGRSVYDIEPTQNTGEVIDEIELNAVKIQKITGKRPHFFRSATAYMDEASVKIAEYLGMKVVNYDILSGDAVAFTPAKTIKDNIIQKTHPGAIVIMHFNHPQWYEKEAFELAIPLLRSMGYTFVKLEDVKLNMSR